MEVQILLHDSARHAVAHFLAFTLHKEDLRPGGAEHAHAAMRAPRDFRATSRGTRIEVGCRAARRERP